MAQFIVITEEWVFSLPLSREENEIIKRMAVVIGEREGFQLVVIKGSEDQVGIVTLHDGPSLAQGEIICPTIR